MKVLLQKEWLPPPP